MINYVSNWTHELQSRIKGLRNSQLRALRSLHQTGELTLSQETSLKIYMSCDYLGLRLKKDIDVNPYKIAKLKILIFSQEVANFSCEGPLSIYI